jgi:hypothetical protein
VHEEAKQYILLTAHEQQFVQPLLRSLRVSFNVDRARRSLRRTPIATLTEFLQLLAEPDCYSEADTEMLVSLPVFFDRWEEQLFKTTLLHFDELRYCRATTPHQGGAVPVKAVVTTTP